ncbi:hypothetical protein [Taibaiella koreensis]|uniref:hypothetical protein n=1 Tax=Taibaiella koreensis TaxID=1268548 RepID=UPI0013C2E50C|nr:hypothetical protein [Taibaiella koreensis]
MDENSQEPLSEDGQEALNELKRRSAELRGENEKLITEMHDTAEKVKALKKIPNSDKH